MAPKVVDLVQGSIEWKEFRRGKIGASSAAAVLGKSRYKTRLQLWEELVFGEKEKSSPAMIRGTELEPVARNWFNNNYEGGFEPKVLVHEKNDDIIASLDCYRVFNGKTQIGEIKCPGYDDHLLALSGEVPEDYMIQIQHQMMVAEVEETRYISFDGKTGVVIVVHRMESFLKELFETETAFLASAIDLRPPEATDRDIFKLEDSSLEEKGRRIVEIDRMTKELIKEREALKAEVTQAMPATYTRMGNILVQKRSRKGSVDYEKIEALKDVDLEKYRNPRIEAWHIWETK